eukprot:CAMPEP_0119340810 /NCGR_PEP_ID=MMETSP1333-20130426/101057_1 /TAXON_ID=418940 /ORGANISM="Scyphosphaera apsteinii, Strain RCC1455" /LENGTH=248 /DNA_ID=CAMNT_0007352641 /DNA_START=140 /DNA_END=886 /DNA_ORIENTATION=-
MDDTEEATEWLLDALRPVVMEAIREEAGRQLSGRSPDLSLTDCSQTVRVEVLMQGFMKKKARKGLRGMHLWHLRWFELTTTSLSYWHVSKQGGVDLRRQVPIHELVGVRVHQWDIERLDVKLKCGRIYELCTPSKAEREEWVKNLQQVLLNVEPEHAAPTPGSLMIQMTMKGLETIYNEKRSASGETEDKELTIDRFSEVSNISATEANDAQHASIVDAMSPDVTAVAYHDRIDRARKANAERRSSMG